MDAGAPTYVHSGVDEAIAVVPVIDRQRKCLRGAQLPCLGFGQRVPAVVQRGGGSQEKHKTRGRGMADVRIHTRVYLLARVYCTRARACMDECALNAGLHTDTRTTDTMFVFTHVEAYMKDYTHTSTGIHAGVSVSVLKHSMSQCYTMYCVNVHG